METGHRKLWRPLYSELRPWQARDQGSFPTLPVKVASFVRSFELRLKWAERNCDVSAVSPERLILGLAANSETV